jgi:hypothetical protein
VRTLLPISIVIGGMLVMGIILYFASDAHVAASSRQTVPVKKRTRFLPPERVTYLRRLWLSIINPVRIALGLFPLYVLPERNLEVYEREMATRAFGLLLEVNEAIRHNQRISSPLKDSLKQQVGQIPENIVALLWKLARLRRARILFGSEFQVETEALEEKLVAEVEHALTILKSVLMYALKLEVVTGDRSLDRLLDSLKESNRRMRDLADTYDQIRSL